MKEPTAKIAGVRFEGKCPVTGPSVRARYDPVRLSAGLYLGYAVQQVTETGGRSTTPAFHISH